MTVPYFFFFFFFFFIIIIIFLLKTENAMFVYVFGSSNAKPEATQIVSLSQPAVERSSVLVGVSLHGINRIPNSMSTSQT